MSYYGNITGPELASSTDTPRIIAQDNAMIPQIYGVKPDLTSAFGPFAMTQIGGSVFYYYDLTGYASGQWFVFVTGTTGGYGTFMWGESYGTLCTNAEQLTPGNAVYDNTANVNVLLSPGGAVGDSVNITRKWLTNKIVPNSSTNPTSITLYDDNGTTPLATRTIANADGSDVSPAQVLSLGALTP